ncbi:nucleic acid-binding protein [Haloquadratum walsbyi]|uniref:Putative nucleic-acid-binding protein containing a Zn-ribbon n=1 Tax=Haloquadratum walsbyi J07HQW2 TaxID=1238425 RepID=U1NI76_9EURY|nr:nucleic acid-binding protein [Haloquadratum walsbyi]ERG96608.1 MAG: putative nucleic-acid-binding protein containing a Zn-ribbon [Haloquadratum walsbyi J07HQW2]
MGLGNEPVDTVNLLECTAEVVTWTKATATPPGAREPNALTIVEFESDDESVRAIGQVTTAEITTGDRVEPVYVSELRDATAGIREPYSRTCGGYRFKPT